MQVPTVPSLAAIAAHAGPPPAPAHVWQSWSLDPSVLLLLPLAAWLYARGLHRIWSRAGTGEGLRIWQAEAFFAGLATVFVALVSPLDGLSSALFSAHMVQHLLLMIVAAPLLVLGSPQTAWLWAFPLAWRRRLGRAWNHTPLQQLCRRLSAAPVAWLLAAVALWVWHLPLLYQAALANSWIHALEHGCLFASAYLFWYVVLAHGAGRRMGHGAALGYLFAMALQSTVLGIAITFSPAPWYPAYGATTAAWHLTASEDQQIAGLLMWIPAGAIYLVVALGLLATWIAASGGPASAPGERPQPETVVGSTEH